MEKKSRLHSIRNTFRKDVFGGNEALYDAQGDMVLGNPSIASTATRTCYGDSD